MTRKMKLGAVLLMLCVTTVSNAQDAALPTSLRVVEEHQGPVITMNHADVLASQNKSGFETGHVVKINGVYHMFVNEMFDRAHRDMRISYWTSSDAKDWARQSTIKESILNRTATNPRSELWLTGVVYNEGEDAWNIFYVAYRAGDKAKGETEAFDYAGRIWRAKSVVQGKNGIAGPYADMEIMMQPDENTQSWEGEQAVASFFPYQVGDDWYALYDGHNHNPRGKWLTGMAKATSMTGPWERMPEGFNPLQIAPEFMENQIVTRLKDGRYMMVFDSFGNQEIGYSFSEDGLNWAPEKRIKVQSKENKWAEDGDHYTRTPLCSIEEKDGTITIVYTAMMKVEKRNFYAVGMCKVGWE
ncbi:MAG: hypothetical protein ACK5IJ_11735 [Mangrovibacterium sp.]